MHLPIRRMPGDIHGRSLYIPDQVEDKLHTGKAGLQVATIEIPINHLLYVEAVEFLLP